MGVSEHLRDRPYMPIVSHGAKREKIPIALSPYEC